MTEVFNIGLPGADPSFSSSLHQEAERMWLNILSLKRNIMCLQVILLKKNLNPFVLNDNKASEGV